MLPHRREPPTKPYSTPCRHIWTHLAGIAAQPAEIPGILAQFPAQVPGAPAPAPPAPAKLPGTPARLRSVRTVHRMCPAGRNRRPVLVNSEPRDQIAAPRSCGALPRRYRVGSAALTSPAQAFPTLAPALPFECPETPCCCLLPSLQPQESSYSVLWNSRSQHLGGF